MTTRTKAISTSGFVLMGILIILTLLSPFDNKVLSWISVGVIGVVLLYAVLLLCALFFEKRYLNKILIEEADGKKYGCF